ncbi:hypothetical protein NKI61_10045 [Mesorhizobium sp. M0514]|uniref:hypothetical protein n=1 Tax=Mesorhizobium sp. M0514 TaxID=2956955 RepID=UPI0033361840
MFPVAGGWRHCISGQFAAAEGLAASPICTAQGMTAQRPTGATRTQYTAVALRPGSPLKIIATADYPALDVKFLDGTVLRDIRWGLDGTLGTNGAGRLRVLDVHLKSGCFDDFVDHRTWQDDPAKGTPANRACDTLGQQMYPLRKWIEAREASGEAWLVVGDFNRRLDAQPGSKPDEIWTALTGYAPNASGVDKDARPDILMLRQPYENMSSCWREFRNPNPTTIANSDDYNILPIEFFLYGTKAAAAIKPNSEEQFSWPSPVPIDKQRLSDHCPSSLHIRFD